MERTRNIQSTPQELKAAVRAVLKAGHVPLLLGPPGVGKTDMLSDLAKEMGFEFRNLDLTTMEPADIRGLPMPDKATKTTEYYAPQALPKPNDPPTMIAFDEITQVKQDMHAPLYQLFLQGKVGDYTLPEGHVLIAAGNRPEDLTGACMLPAAIRDRCAIFHVRPEIKDWTQWAHTQGISSTIVAFLNLRPDFLIQVDKEGFKDATPRGWTLLDKDLKELGPNPPINDIQRIVESRIAAGIAYEYMAFLRLVKKGVTQFPPAKMLESPETCALPEDPDMRYAVSAGLANLSNQKNFNAVVTVLERMGADYAAFAINSAVTRDPKLMGSSAFTNWKLTHGKDLFYDE